MKLSSLGLYIFVVCALVIGTPALTFAETAKIGIVIMHGKGGSPDQHVNGIANALERDGYLVANLEMPWSKRHEYNASVSAAEEQVDSALTKMRKQGATHLFVSGHSQGGGFALYFGGRHRVDGVIGLAPGGNVGRPRFSVRSWVNSVARARKLIEKGKGDETTRLMDHEDRKVLSLSSSHPTTISHGLILTEQ